MCIFGGASPAPPPPLPPAPPPPEPPKQPTPPPEPLDKEVNPKVMMTKSKKAKSNYSQGTNALRIKLSPKVNLGTDTQSGGLN